MPKNIHTIIKQGKAGYRSGAIDSNEDREETDNQGKYYDKLPLFFPV